MGYGKTLEQRWLRINAELKRIGCNFSIPKIKSYRDGAHEIMGIKSVYLESRPYYHIVTFEVKMPFTGKPGQFSVKMCSGILIIPIIDGKIVLVEQFRLTRGNWAWELPRMFIEDIDTEKVGLNAVEMIFRDEVEAALDGKPYLKSVDLIHPGIFEDTGMSMTSFPVYLVKITGAALKDYSRKEFRKMGIRFTWKAFDLLEIRKAMLPHSSDHNGLQIADSHTLSAIFALQNLIELEGYSLN